MRGVCLLVQLLPQLRAVPLHAVAASKQQDVVYAPGSEHT